MQFLIESSSYMQNLFKGKITKRCYQNFDKDKIKFDFKSKSSQSQKQKHCNDPDPNVSLEHFPKIVNSLLDGHALFKSFNKKTNIFSS